MRIVTWNINSIRQRLHLIEMFEKEHAPDVICLQEIKAQNKDFPGDDLRAMGFEHQAVMGQKGYNGVAILSKQPFEAEGTRHWVGKEDSRHQFVTLQNGIELHNFYVPAGGDEPDRELNEKFAHKLDFVDEMASWFPEAHSNDKPMVLVGDLNIAPLETDVWNHKQLLKVVSHTPIETEKFTNAFNAFGWVDAMREKIPAEELLYTWWSYRARDWRAANKGRRLDHVWVTPPLKDRLTHLEVVLDARGWEKPSDHAPVMFDIAD